MPKLLPLMFLCFSAQFLFTQEERSKIYGSIQVNEENAADIHVINKNSNKGTITNANGYFQIPVKTGDTLIFSGIQFYNKELIIKDKHIIDKTINIKLTEKNNQLEEITVKNLNLQGNLSIDVANSEDHLVFYDEDLLGLAEMDFSIPVIMEIDEFSRSRSSNDAQLMPPQGNIIALATYILSPLAKEISKIGRTKRNIKAYDKRRNLRAQKAPKNIRTSFGDGFFVNTLKIPVDKIDEFIAYCRPKGLIELYLDDKKIEMIDLMLKAGHNFRNLKNNEE